MRLHLQEQVSLYGEQSLVNLVNQKGYEKPVKDAYEKHIAEASGTHSLSRPPHMLTFRKAPSTESQV